MSSLKQSDGSEVGVDAKSLYLEETFTDLKVATIKRLSPVKADGTPDPDREALFIGQSTIVTDAGPIPVDCRMDASNLEEALHKFPDALAEAVERLMEEVRELQRQASSRLVTPGGPLPPGGLKGGGGLGGGGLGGGLIGGR